MCEKEIIQVVDSKKLKQFKKEKPSHSLNRVCAVHLVKVFQPVLSFSVFTEYDEHER